jgi:hypothetical protein
MFEKRWLHALDDLGKLVEVVVYLLRYASEILSANVRASTYL